MVDTQRVHNTWLHKADFSAEGWAKLLDNFIGTIQEREEYND